MFGEGRWLLGFDPIGDNHVAVWCYYLRSFVLYVATTIKGILTTCMTLRKAEAILLGPTETHADKMEEILGLVYSSQVDFADLYLQNTVEETWSLEDGQVKDVDFSIDRGFGLRAVKQDQVGFAYADDITLPLLRNAAQAAKRIASPHDRTLVTCHAKPLGHSLYHAIDPVCSL